MSNIEQEPVIETAKTQPNNLRRRVKYAAFGVLTGLGIYGAGLLQAGLDQPGAPGAAEAQLEDAEDATNKAGIELDSVRKSVGKVCVDTVAENFKELPPAEHISYIYDDFSSGSLSQYEVEAIEYEYVTSFDAAEAVIVKSGACETNQDTAAYNITLAHEALFDVQVAQDDVAEAKAEVKRYEDWENAMDSMLSPWLIGAIVVPAAGAGVLLARRTVD